MPINLTSNQLIHLKCNDNAANGIITNNGTLSTTFSAINPSTTSAISTAGKINNAFVFDGIDQYAFGAEDLSAYTEGSISFWYYAINNDSSEGVWGIGDDNQAAFQAMTFFQSTTLAGTVQFSFRTAAGYQWSTDRDDAAYLNTWKHIVLVGGTGGIKIYVDGVEEVASWNFSAGSSASTAWFDDLTLCEGIWVGARPSVPKTFGQFQIDDFRIFDKRLSQAEVDFLYNSGNGTELNIPPLIDKTTYIYE